MSNTRKFNNAYSNKNHFTRKKLKNKLSSQDLLPCPPGKILSAHEKNIAQIFTK